MKKKTPKSGPIVTALHRANKTIFTVEDVRQIIPMEKQAVYNLLSHLKKKGAIGTIKPGKYTLLPPHIHKGPYIENVWITGKELANSEDYFFSHYSAMDLHDMLVRPVSVIYITMPKQLIQRKISNFTFHFVYTKKENIWGIEDVWVTQSDKVRCSDLERTILDCLQRPSLCGGIIEISGGIWKQRDKLSTERLIGYLDRLGKDVVAKRLGYILETLNVSTRILIPFLRQYILKKGRYYLLDPTRSADRRFKNRWRLIANVSPEEILAMTEA